VPKAKSNVLIDELLALLRGGNAHMGFDEAIADFPLEAINKKAPHFNYTLWLVVTDSQSSPVFASTTQV